MRRPGLLDLLSSAWIDVKDDRSDSQPHRPRAEEVLVDGGYVSKGSIEDIADTQVTMYGPPPESKVNPDAPAIKPTDSAAIRALKQRMASERGKKIYKVRAATAELVNADLKTWRTLDRFVVRGKRKAMCVVLWNVLAYMQIGHLTSPFQLFALVDPRAEP